MTCAQSSGTGTKLVEEEDRKDQTDQGRGTVEKDLMNKREAEEIDDGGKKSGKGSKPDWYGDEDKRGTGNEGNGQGQGRGSILL